MKLQLFPEDWQTALAVVAHPDDLEYGGSSAIARWTAQGKRIVYLMLSRGEAGIEGMDPARTAEVRILEQTEAARLVGVEDVRFLDFPDSQLRSTPELAEAIKQVIDDVKPDGIITLNYHQQWPGGSQNQSDHIAAGQAILEAAAGQAWIAVLASPSASHFVDVTGYIDAGLASLSAHKAYLNGLADKPDPGAIVKAPAARTGQACGVDFAVALELLQGR